MLDRLKALPAVAALPTPVMIFCERPMRDALRAMRDGVASRFPGRVSVHFAVKCAYRPAVLRALREAGAGAEVMTDLELRMAQAAGFQGAAIVCNGLGRSRAMLEAALREAARIVIDCWQDLETLLALSGAPRVGLRVQPDLAGFDTPYAATPHKLGMRPGSAEWEAVVRRCRDARIEVDMLSAHVASNVRDAALHCEVLKQMAPLRAELGDAVRTINLGGGFAAFQAVDTARWADTFGRLGAECAALFDNEVELMLEPGRYLVGSAAFARARVTAVKDGGDSPFVIVDAATNSLLPHSEAEYTLLEPPTRPAGRHRVRVVDGITSVRAVIIPDARLDALPRVGDLVWIGNCGAYTTSMGGFWAYDPLPVAFVDAEERVSWDLAPEDVARARQALLGM